VVATLLEVGSGREVVVPETNWLWAENGFVAVKTTAGVGEVTVGVGGAKVGVVCVWKTVCCCSWFNEL